MAVNVYSNCSTLVVNTCYLYNNSNLTSPVSNGKYSDGVDCYTVTGGNGQITSIESCPPSTYSVGVYARHGNSASPNAIDIYWSTNDISYTFAATLGVTTTCTILFPDINVSAGSTVYFRVQDASLSSYIYFNATDGVNQTDSCPANSDTYCTYSFVVNSSNHYINITAYNVTMFGDFSYCS